MDNPHAEPDVPESRRRSARKAAVALIFIEEDSPKLILTKRSDALPFAGQWCFPGGKEEAEDDGLPSTAKRESHEEIGLDPDHMLHLASMGQYYTHTGFCIYPELFVLAPKAAWRTSFEVSEIALVPLAELANTDRYELFWRSNDPSELPIQVRRDDYFRADHLNVYPLAASAYRLIVSAVWVRLVIAVEVLAPVEIHVVGDDEKASSYHCNGSLCHE